MLTCSNIPWRWPLINCFASRHLKDFSICHMHINMSWSLLVLTLSLGKTGSSYATDFLKEFWPPDKAIYHVIWVLTHTRVLKTSLLSFKDKQMLMPLLLFVSILEMQQYWACFQRHCLSVHYCVNSLLFPSQS